MLTARIPIVYWLLATFKHSHLVGGLSHTIYRGDKVKHCLPFLDAIASLGLGNDCRFSSLVYTDFGKPPPTSSYLLLPPPTSSYLLLHPLASSCLLQVKQVIGLGWTYGLGWTMGLGWTLLGLNGHLTLDMDI